MISRRSFGIGVVALVSGDGLRRPQNAPPGVSATPGVQPGTSNAVVLANRVIVQGAHGGVFVYDSAGRLADVVSGSSGTDPLDEAAFGPGITSVFPGVPSYGVNLEGAVITFFPSGAQITAGDAVNGNLVIDAGGTGSVFLTSPVNATAGTAAAPTLITTDAWHPLGALGAGSGFAVNNARYQLTTDGRYEVDINLTAGAATVAGNYAFPNSLPAGPPFACSYPLGWNGTTAAGVNTATLRVSAGGVVTLQLPALPNLTVVSATQRIPAN